MKTLFRSNELQRQFERDGFVKVQLLNTLQVNKLLEAYTTVAPQHEAIGIPYITTSHSNNAGLITKVDDMLQAVLAPVLDKVLVNYHLLFGNFLVKMPVANSETDPHQDITFVDEREFVSVNIWVALQDTNRQNGCMYFMRGSHTIAHTIRPTHHYRWKYELVKEEIKARSEIFEAKAGEAFIFHHGVLHGSFPNNSNRPRIAAVIAAYSANAPLIHYYLPDPNSNRLQKYAMNKEAYLSFVKQQPPNKGIYLCDEEFDFTPMSQKEFLQLTGGNKNWLRKITSLWNNP
jgi:hypothetical protein